MYICPDIILLLSFSKFCAYDLTSCDISCDYSHVPLHHQNKKEKKKKSQKKRNIKSRKIDKRKEKY